jgi:hypothetical protein
MRPELQLPEPSRSGVIARCPPVWLTLAVLLVMFSISPVPQLPQVPQPYP